MRNLILAFIFVCAAAAQDLAPVVSGGGGIIFPLIVNSGCTDVFHNNTGQPSNTLGTNQLVLWNSPSPLQGSGGTCPTMFPMNTVDGLNTNGYFFGVAGFGTAVNAYNGFQNLNGGMYSRGGTCPASGGFYCFPSLTADSVIELEFHSSSSSLPTLSTLCVITSDPIPSPVGSSCYGGLAFEGGTTYWYWDSTNKMWDDADFSLIGSGVRSLNSLTGNLSIAGTSNEIIVSPSGSTITLSTPQAIATTSGVTFATVTATGAIQSSATGTNVAFQTSGGTNFLVWGNGDISGTGSVNESGPYQLAGTTFVDTSRNGNFVSVTASGAIQSSATGTNVMFQNSGGTTFQVFGNGNIATRGGLYLANSAGTYSAAFLPPSSISANVSWTVPAVDAAGCFESNGSGVISIVSCTSSWTLTGTLLHASSTTYEIAAGESSATCTTLSSPACIAEFNGNMNVIGVVQSEVTGSAHAFQVGYSGTNNFIVDGNGNISGAGKLAILNAGNTESTFDWTSACDACNLYLSAPSGNASTWGSPFAVMVGTPPALDATQYPSGMTWQQAAKYYLGYEGPNQSAGTFLMFQGPGTVYPSALSATSIIGGASGSYGTGTNTSCYAYVTSAHVLCNIVLAADYYWNAADSAYSHWDASLVSLSTYYPNVWSSGTTNVRTIDMEGIADTQPSVAEAMHINALGRIGGSGSNSSGYTNGINFLPGSVQSTGNAILIDAAGPCPTSASLDSVGNLYSLCTTAGSGKLTFQARDASGNALNPTTMAVTSSGLGYISNSGAGGFGIWADGGSLTLDAASGTLFLEASVAIETVGTGEIQGNFEPTSSNTYTLGTSRYLWSNVYSEQYCLGTNCITSWPSGGISSVSGTANQITASTTSGAVTLSLPTGLILPGSAVFNNAYGVTAYYSTSSSTQSAEMDGGHISVVTAAGTTPFAAYTSTGYVYLGTLITGSGGVAVCVSTGGQLYKGNPGC